MLYTDYKIVREARCPMTKMLVSVCFFLTALSICLVWPLSPATAALTLKFVNENTEYTDSNVYFRFTAPTPTEEKPFTATYGSGTAVNLDQNYSISDIGAGGITLSRVTTGVIYVSLGSQMEGSAPSFTNTSDLDYNKRWDKFEITYNGATGDVANMTGINSFAIPQQLKSSLGGTTKQTLGYSISGNEMREKLGALTNNDSTAVLKNGSNFLRVVGPTSYASGSVGPYPVFTNYVNSVNPNNPATTIAKIVDSYSGPAEGKERKASQTYNFNATFDASGNLVLTGTMGVVTGTHTITIAKSDIAYHIYANNPTYKIDGTTDGTFNDNDVYSAVVRDMLAGFAIGYVGSTVEDPNHPGVQLKDEESNQWWESGLAFSEVQPDNEYFNAYAEVFYQNSNTYGFPFSDRLPHGAVQVSLNPNNVDTLTFTVCADSAVPEPSSVVFFGIGLLGLARFARKKFVRDDLR